ncbi:MAG TPA: hypothetical protein P5545_07925 [Bacteroidota bacterium]|nr:hypothetical protein [Candidatus Kapabacteria bacterium]HRS02461.1 hypothetical protein [Bacteroidota bacterium]HRT68060.1 hypothetical protein [Bacteroidota bacterium]
MSSLFQIFIGALLLSLVHASIPNHWLSIVAISRSENWSIQESMSVTLIAGSAHILSTIIVGIIIGFFGYTLSSSYEFVTKIAAPLVLFILGAIYIIIDIKENRKHHYHEHIDTEKIIKEKNKNKTAIITSLAIAMFFSPCIEIEAYYFPASTRGWIGIAIVSIVYFIVTLAGMLLLVNLAMRGVQKINFHFMDHHSRLVSGSVLILLGILAFFID